MRRPKTNRVPRVRAGGLWTEAAWWSFLRSGLRQMSRRWPPIARAMQQGRRKYIGPNKRQKWESQCGGCGEWFAAKHMSVDHIDPCGPLSKPEHIECFVMRLFCEPDGLRRLCVRCHAERHKGRNQD